MGTCVHESRVYIVTEYVPGGNVKDYIRRNQPKPTRRLRHDDNDIDKHNDDDNDNHKDNHHKDKDTLQYYRLAISFSVDIARALAYLHARGIIHRDLKLENLLITDNNRVKV